MPLGPVFHAELLTTARRGRYYAIRVIYGLVLLLVLWLGYHSLTISMAYRGADELTIGEMTAFAQATFGALVTAQVYAILLLTPALVAPVIASEKSRKTFHYLLASQLSSAEIVLGKLGARVLILTVILATGLPIFSLLVLFGGIEPAQILRSYVFLGGLLAFMAGQSILVSTLTTEPRRALFYAYVTPAAVLILPYALVLLLRFRWPEFTDALLSALSNVWPLPRSPLPYGGLPVFPRQYNANWAAGDPEAELLRVGIVWSSWGLVFTSAANFLLRPLGRREERRGRVRLGIDSRGRWHWRVIPRPACGDDAMLWKERHTSRSGGLVKLASLLVHLFVLVLVGSICFELTRDSIRELLANGYTNPGGIFGNARHQFGEAAKTIGAWVVALWMLGAAAVAACSITSEREGDTWISLLSTPLTAAEIIRAKMLGAVLRFKWLGVMLLMVWFLATLVGALHPLGLLLGVVEVPIFVGFAAALGAISSLESKTTTRALVMALGLLGFLNGGYLLLGYASPPGDWRPFFAGVAPFLLYASLSTYHDFVDPASSEFFKALPALAIGLPIYLLGTIALASLAIARFDGLADRPETLHDSGTALPASEQRKRWAT